MSTERGADGSPETTERLLQQSRELLETLAHRLTDQEGAAALDPTADPEVEPEA
jgi:hypothetical protein